MIASSTLYRKDDCYHELYIPRSAEFIDAGRKVANKLKPSSGDQTKVGLILVDMQVDFVDPKGTLSVPNAQKDLQNIVEFIYGNTDKITTIYASTDQHKLYQIFFGSWWVDQKGNHPAPFTIITLDDVKKGKWTAIIEPNWSHNTYLPYLEAEGKKALMIWPEHCLMGRIGSTLMPALCEAIEYHSAARYSQPTIIAKGDVPGTEHYGIFGAQKAHPQWSSSQLNVAVLDLIGKNDIIFVTGEAKSHCVLDTMDQLVKYFGAKDPQVLKKIRFLTDCTSSVQHPQVDFEAIANAELKLMEKKGIQLIKSTDPIF